MRKRYRQSGFFFILHIVTDIILALTPEGGKAGFQAKIAV